MLENLNKHILILTSSLRCGGSERVAVKLAEWCCNAGYDVSLVTWSSKESDFYPIPEYVDRIGLNLESGSVTLIQAIRSNYRRSRAVKKIIQTKRSDYLVCFGDQCGILGIMAAINTNTKVVFSERKDPLDSPLTGIWRCLQKLVYKRAYMAVALSQGASALLKKEYPSLKVAVIGNASSFGRNYISTAINEVPNILFVGRLHQQKGVDILLKAIAQLVHNGYTSFHCNIVGDGEHMYELKVLADRLGVNGYVSLVGSSTTVVDWYSKSDIFVLPSTFEGFPNSLIEAMSMGLCVVSSECGSAVKDIFDVDYKVGYTFPVNNVEALADVLKRAINYSTEREFLQVNALLRSRDFSEQTISKQWMEVLA